MGQREHRSAAKMFTALAKTDINLRMINVGGGFPAKYRGGIVPAVVDCAQRSDVRHDSAHFGNKPADMIIEPGRSIVGNYRRDPERGGADLAEIGQHAEER